ncbi:MULTISPECIES: phage integrase N-terminal SAM-like domain-containing protein [Marinobacter]|uniref:phage integrase N-terminal SAM-like domain-containing protein n=1 Tax=Marinobacter TaxID=2742 RepID=UPI00222E2A99|nr:MULTISPECIES: phage integrase N-terminal SAM-like domain-containing protein [Marinobacter]MDP4533270.1 phage integrase N-terminal SAM-like domain-containing protein [Marinobacter salarius]
MAYKTEQTYCHWIKRFIRFHGMQHPSACSAKEVEQFLLHMWFVKEALEFAAR